MLKERARIITAFLLVTDLVIVTGAFVLAHWLRSDLLPRVATMAGSLYPLARYLPLLPLALSIWAVLLLKLGVYHPNRTVPLREEIAELARVCALSGVFLTLAIYFLRLDTALLDDGQISRPWIVLIALLAFVGLVAKKLLIHLTARYFPSRGLNYRTLLIVGTSDSARAIADSVERHRYWGTHIAGFLTEEPESGTVGEYPVLGTLEDLPAVVESRAIDEVIFACQRSDPERDGVLLRSLQGLGVCARFALTPFPEAVSAPQVSELEGIPLLTYSRVPAAGSAKLTKRLPDIVTTAQQAATGPAGAPSRSPLSDRVCDGVTIAFALWTLCCLVVVTAGGSLRTLLALYAVVGALALTAFLIRRPSTPALGTAALPKTPAGYRRLLRALAIGGATAGVAGAVLFRWRGDALVLWWWAIALLGAAAAITLFAEISFNRTPCAAPPASNRWLEAALWVLALVCVVVTLVSHRPDADDALYVGLAVQTADHPDAPLLSGDSLHGIDSVFASLPVYRFHSYEVWNGALAYLTGVPAIYCFHWLSAAFAALLVPFAYARLFRLLTPRRWLWAVVTLIVLFVVIGETHRWYGNFAFVRMWQGKSVYLSVFLPLIYAYAMKFALRPSWYGGLLLGAAQIAAVGCSSSALWGAPVAAFAALAAGVRPTRRGLSVFAAGVLSSALVLAVGWRVKQLMSYQIDKLAARPPQVRAGEDLGQALGTVLGDSRLLILGVLALVVAWVCCRNDLSRRFALWVPLIVLLTLLNPYTSHWMTAHVTGLSYWRTLWALPIPILIVLLLITPIGLGASAWARVGGRTAYFLLLAVVAIWVPRYGALDKRNEQNRIDWPGLKVPPIHYRWAAALNATARQGARVLAPDEINVWIPTFHDHAYPLSVRGYLRLTGEERRDRNRMVRLAEGFEEEGDASAFFRQGLERFDVRAVCLLLSERVGQPREVLRNAGFHRVDQGEHYEMWLRAAPAETPPRSVTVEVDADNVAPIAVDDGFSVTDSFTYNATGDDPVPLTNNLPATVVMEIDAADIRVELWKSGPPGSEDSRVFTVPADVDCGAGCPFQSAAFATASTIPIQATAEHGFLFDGWTGHPDCADGELSPTGDRTCIASFIADDPPTDSVLITIEKAGAGDGQVLSSPGGIDCGADCSGLFNARVYLSVFPDSGSEFAGFSDPNPPNNADCENGDLSLGARETLTCRATFNELAGGGTLNIDFKGTGSPALVTSSPTGIRCTSNCSAVFASGTVVSLSTRGSVTWSGDCTVDPVFAHKATVTVSGATTCVARFN